VNRKRVQRLMREMGLAGMAPGPATSARHPKHKANGDSLTLEHVREDVKHEEVYLKATATWPS
jgi:hypothetical protein